jgi:type I restriction enzyme S subunit
MSVWKEIKIKDVADVKGRVGWKGYTIKDLRDNGALTIGAGQINSLNRLDLSQATFLSDEKYYESPEIMIEEGDLLIVQRGFSRKTCFDRQK